MAAAGKWVPLDWCTLKAAATCVNTGSAMETALCSERHRPAKAL